MNDISTKTVVSPNGVGVTGSIFSEPVKTQDVTAKNEDTNEISGESPPTSTELGNNCEVITKDETADAQVDKVEKISDVIKCDSIEEQTTKDDSPKNDTSSENKTEHKNDDITMEIDQITEGKTETSKRNNEQDLPPNNTNETADIKENVTKLNDEASILDNLDVDDDGKTEIVVVIEEKQEANDETSNSTELNVIDKINDQNNLNDVEDVQMQVHEVASEKTCDDSKIGINDNNETEKLHIKVKNEIMTESKTKESNNIASVTKIEVPLDSPKIDISKALLKGDVTNSKEESKPENVSKATVENNVVIHRPSEATTPDNINQISNPRTESKKSEMHLVKNIMIKQDSIKIPFVPKPEAKLNKGDSNSESKPIYYNDMQTVRKILENSDLNKTKLNIQDDTKSITIEANTTKSDAIEATKPILKIPSTLESKVESKPQIKVRNLTIKTEPGIRNDDVEMSDVPSVSSISIKASLSQSEAKSDKKTMNGDVSKDDHTSKRRASEEVDTDSPLKKLCLEVEKTFPQHDTMINDFIQNTTKNSIDEIQKHTEQLLTEIQTLRELAQKKEQEWNNILHLKKVKEEILLRLLRRKQVLSFEKSDLSNLERGKEALEHLNQNKNLAIDKSDEISGVALKPPTTNPSPILQPPMMPPVSSHFNPLSGLPPPYDKVAHMQGMAKNMFPQSIMMPGPNMTGFPRDMNGQLNNMNNFNLPIGRQGPTKDVKSIIADYRQRNPDMVPRRGRRMKSILNPNMMNNQPRQIAPKLDNLSSLGMIFNNLDMNQKAMLERLTQMQGAGLPNGMSFKDVLVQFATMQNPNMMPGRPDPMSCRPDLMSGRPDQMSGRPDQMSGRPDQMSGRPDQMSGRPDQMSGRPDQMSGRPDQMLGRSDQMSGRPDPMSGRPEQMLGRPEMVQRPEQMTNRREEAMSRQETAHNRNERRRQERQSHHEEVQKQSDRASSSPRLPPPPYPEISLLPVNSQDGSQGPQQNSLLHGILTKPTSPSSQGYSPTLAKLLTSPDASNVASLPTLGQAKNCGEITITPVQPTPPPQENTQQEKPDEVVQLDEEDTSTWESQPARESRESPETTGRLVIDESSEPDTPLCQGCRRRDAQFVCAGCANQWYCSRDCQVAAWDEHSEMCSG